MIELYAIRKKIKGRWIFNGLSLRISDRGVTAFVAPSGYGKSTLLNIIYHATSYKGKVVIDGKEYRQGQAAECHKIAYCSCDSTLFEKKTVWENILFATGEKYQEEANRLLVRFGLMRQKYQRVNQLSKGQKGLVKIIQTLVSDANYLLFDEVTASLDQETAFCVLQEIRNAASQKGVVIATHDDEVMQFADEIIDLQEISGDGEEPNASVSIEERPMERDPLYGAYNKRKPLNFFLAGMMMLITFLFLIELQIESHKYNYISPYLNENEFTVSEYRSGSLYEILSDYPDISEIRRTDAIKTSIFIREYQVEVPFLEDDGFVEWPNQNQKLCTYTRMTKKGRKNQKIEWDYQVMISSKVFDSLKKSASKLGIRITENTELLYDNFLVIDIYESDKYEIALSETCYETYLAKRFVTPTYRLIKNESERADNYDFYADASIFNDNDVLSSIRHYYKMKNEVMDGKFKLIDDYRTLIVNNEELYSFLWDYPYGRGILSLPYRDQEILEGRKPEKTGEYVYPYFYKKYFINYYFNMSEEELADYLEREGIVGYYRCDDLFSSSLPVLVTEETFCDSVLKNTKNIAFFSTSWKEISEDLTGRGYEVVTWKDLHRNPFWNRNGIILILLFGFLEAAGAMFVYLFILYLIKHPYYQRRYFYGVNRRAFSLREGKENLKHLFFSVIAPQLFLVSLTFLYSLMTGLSLWYSFFIFCVCALEVTASCICLVLYSLILCRKRFFYR